MGIVIRQSAKSVVLTYLGIGIGIINTLWLFPYIFTETQIGLVRTIINVALLFSTFASLAAGNIPTKFFPYFKDYKNKNNGFLFFLLVIGTIGSTIFILFILNFKFLFVEAFVKNSPLLLNYFYQLIPFTIILVFITIFESYNVIQQNPVFPIFTREVLTRIFLSLSLLLFLFIKFEYQWFVNILIGFYGIVLIVLIYYTYTKRYLFIKPNKGIFKSPMFKSILVFSGFVLMGNASGVVINNIDSLMLSAYSGLRITGIYTIAFFIATFIEIPKKSLSQVLIPLVSEANKDNNIKKLEELYKKSSITQLVIGGILFLLIWFNIDNIFKLIPHGNIYAQGKWVVFFIGLGKIFDMATGINQEIVGTSKYYKLDLSFYPLYGLIAVATNLFLIPKLGMTGAAVATALSVFLINSIRYFLLLFLFKIHPFSLNTLKTLLIVSFTFLINNFMPHIEYHFLLDIIARSIIIVSVFISLVLFFRVSEDINAAYKILLVRIFPK